MKLVVLLALAVAAVTSVGAQTPAETAVGPRVDPAAAAYRARGLELGYNLDHADAIAAFTQLIAADPHGAAAYRLLAATTWIRLLFEQGAITVDDFLGRARTNLPPSAPAQAPSAIVHDSLDQAMKIAERRLRDHPADADAHYQVGAAYGFLASYTATVEGRLLGSLGSARRAYREHERVLTLDPQRKDAGLIVGMCRYTVSELSMPLRLGAHLAGLGGGRERGLQMVEDAARYPSDVQPNAQFALILMYNRAARYDDALRLIDELQRRYPRNRLLWLEAGGTALRAGRLADARAALEEGLARLSRDTRPRARGEDARWRYTYGATLVALNDVAPAERELRAALDGAASDWVRGRVHKELGKLADLAADRSRAVAEYRLADRLCRQDHDAICSDDVKTLMKKGYR